MTILIVVVAVVIAFFADIIDCNNNNNNAYEICPIHRDNACSDIDFPQLLMAETSLDAQVAQLKRENALLQQKLTILTGNKRSNDTERVESIHDVHVRLCSGDKNEFAVDANEN